MTPVFEVEEQLSAPGAGDGTVPFSSQALCWPAVCVCGVL